MHPSDTLTPSQSRTMASHIPSNLVDEIPAPAPIHRHTLPRQPGAHPTSPRHGSNNDTTQRSHVSLKTATRTFLSAFIILGSLLFALVLDIVGLALYMVFVPKANEGPFIILCALFILVYVWSPLTRYISRCKCELIGSMIAIAGFIFRQSIIIYTLLHPRQEPENSNLPTWLTELPTYRDILRSDGQPIQSTSAGTEGWSGMLPSYGEARGDELLMKGSMRDSRGSRDMEMGSVERSGDIQMTVEAVEHRPPVSRV